MCTGLEHGPPSVEKALGALPVVCAFPARLEVAGTVDRLCPVRGVARFTNSHVVEALVANRLTSPSPPVRVADWARTLAGLRLVPAHAGNPAYIARPGPSSESSWIS